MVTVHPMALLTLSLASAVIGFLGYSGLHWVMCKYHRLRLIYEPGCEQCGTSPTFGYLHDPVCYTCHPGPVAEPAPELEETDAGEFEMPVAPLIDCEKCGKRERYRQPGWPGDLIATDSCLACEHIYPDDGEAYRTPKPADALD